MRVFSAPCVQFTSTMPLLACYDALIKLERMIELGTDGDVQGFTHPRKYYVFDREPIHPAPDWLPSLGHEHTCVLYRLNALMPEVDEDAEPDAVPMSVTTLITKVLGAENLGRFEELLRAHTNEADFITPVTCRKYYQTLGSLIKAIVGKHGSRAPRELESDVKRAQSRVLDFGTLRPVGLSVCLSVCLSGCLSHVCGCWFVCLVLVTHHVFHHVFTVCYCVLGVNREWLECARKSTQQPYRGFSY